jgi:hypothetical protein
MLGSTKIIAAVAISTLAIGGTAGSGLLNGHKIHAGQSTESSTPQQVSPPDAVRRQAASVEGDMESLANCTDFSECNVVVQRIGSGLSEFAASAGATGGEGCGNTAGYMGCVVRVGGADGCQGVSQNLWYSFNSEINSGWGQFAHGFTNSHDLSILPYLAETNLRVADAMNNIAAACSA